MIYDFVLPSNVQDRISCMKRFISRTKMAKNGCVEWKRGKTSTGYGAFQIGGKTLKAHRVSALMAGMDISGKVVCHSCDNIVCVNPEHLWVGTLKENSIDMVKKGRQSKQKILYNDIPIISHKHASGVNYKEIALEYNCSPSSVLRAIRKYKGGQ